jgi:hypothetical protein
MNVSNFSGPNPISRVLLEKYLLLVGEEGNKENIIV